MSLTIISRKHAITPTQCANTHTDTHISTHNHTHTHTHTHVIGETYKPEISP